MKRKFLCHVHGKIRKLLNFRNGNHSTKNAEMKNESNPTEISDTKLPKINSEFPENTIPFVSGKFRKFEPGFFIE